MKVECFMKVTGTATTDGLGTITVGIAIMTVTSAMTGTGINGEAFES
jgi:hypothetical protein